MKSNFHVYLLSSFYIRGCGFGEGCSHFFVWPDLSAISPNAPGLHERQGRGAENGGVRLAERRMKQLDLAAPLT